VSLLSDEKEKAEHLMLVDLGRNDLGRVAEIGTVQVTDLMIVERYSHVMHLVSNITCDLKSDYDAFDLLTATFPAGYPLGRAQGAGDADHRRHRAAHLAVPTAVPSAISPSAATWIWPLPSGTACIRDGRLPVYGLAPVSSPTPILKRSVSKL
jgi:hypothetical protein